MIKMILCLACVLLTIPPASAGSKLSLAAIYSQKNGKTASGEAFSPKELTAAHRSLPFGSIVRVTNLRNGRTVVVRINDRGPFNKDRIIDLTPAAAQKLSFSGLAPVTLEVITTSPIRVDYARRWNTDAPAELQKEHTVESARQNTELSGDSK